MRRPHLHPVLGLCRQAMLAWCTQNRLRTQSASLARLLQARLGLLPPGPVHAGSSCELSTRLRVVASTCQTPSQLQISPEGHGLPESTLGKTGGHALGVTRLIFRGGTGAVQHQPWPPTSESNWIDWS